MRSYFPKWDLTLVLKALVDSQFDFASTCSLFHLTLRTIFLTDIAAGAGRVSELCALSVKELYCLILPDMIVLRPVPSFLPKISTTIHMNWESVLPAFPEYGTGPKWEKLDLVKSLTTYKELILKAGELFYLARVSEKIPPRILSAWISKTIQIAYRLQGLLPPEELMAHSIWGL